MKQLKQSDSSDYNAGSAGEKARNAAREIVKVTDGAVSRNAVHSILIATMAANGLIHAIAERVARRDSESEPLTSASVLFSALLAYRYGPCEVESGKVQGEFSPLVVMDAIRDYEKLVGQAPDDFLNETMCRVARECAQSPEIAAQVAAGRAAAFKDERRTLN